MGYYNTEVYNVMTQWTLEDNHGVPYPIVIPNSFLIPKAWSKLISLQYWAQMAKDKQTKIMRNMVHHLQECSYSGVRAKIATNACLNWTKQGTNAMEFHSTPGYQGYDTFCQEAQILHQLVHPDQLGPKFFLAINKDDEETIEQSGRAKIDLEHNEQ